MITGRWLLQSFPSWPQGESKRRGRRPCRGAPVASHSSGVGRRGDGGSGGAPATSPVSHRLHATHICHDKVKAAIMSNLEPRDSINFSSITAVGSPSFSTRIFKGHTTALNQFSSGKRIRSLIFISVLTAYVSFTISFLPNSWSSNKILSTNKPIFDTAAQFLNADWSKFLLPQEYESGEVLWLTTSLLPIYFAEKYFGGLASFLLFSCLFLTVVFIFAWLCTRSLAFSSTIIFMFAFGTQLEYTYNYGDLTILYILLSYIAVNFTVAVLLVSGHVTGWRWLIAFISSLCLVALATEWWINYATAIIAASGFGVIWSSRHQYIEIRIASTWILLLTGATLSLYLTVRLQNNLAQFVNHGAEEELLLTYTNYILMFEDFVTNYFTLLYMMLTNYLPSFVTSSNSLTYLGKAAIIAEQNGYDAAHQQLVLMSHLFLWRFYAGVADTLFVGCVVWAVYRAWRSSSLTTATVAALMLMIISGFSTHLMIKMRPSNTVPAVTYKVTISVAALTLLVSYLTMTVRQWLRSRWAYSAVFTGVWISVFLAALTRPGMQARLLNEVGLIGLRDPLGQILNWLP
jgi:hypothetical protein